MSSDTLRGIGQEGDGEVAGEGVKGAVKSSDGEGANSEPTGGPLKLSEELKERVEDQVSEADRKVHSLDSRVPEPRSLDSSNPDETPSLDAKVSIFAATLLGVPAPVVDRTRGTVQGRDVHLPVDARRSAGLRPVAGGDHQTEQAAPQSVDYSEPTRADSVVGAAVARASVTNEPQVDRDSHGPWYDQLPQADEVYDDPGPNILARVAIGAALCAMLSILIFGFVRLRGRNATAEEGLVRQVGPATTVQIPPPQPAPAPTVAMPGFRPPLTPVLPDLPPTDDPRLPASPPPFGDAVDSSATESPPKRRPPTARPSSVAPSARGISSRGAAPDPIDGTRLDAPGTAASESRRTRPPSGTSAEPTEPLAVRPQVSDSPTPAPTLRSPPSDRQKTKPVYDPDSTLPLNLE